jgi:hypothetical protein
MPENKRKGMPAHIRALFSPQAVHLRQTRRASRLLPAHALRRLENHRVSCTYAPVRRQNSLTRIG